MRATRLSIANYNTTLSSDSLESGTGSSNSLRYHPVRQFSDVSENRSNSRVCAEFPSCSRPSLGYGAVKIAPATD
jgi:hypothetical protein